jgi:hypothetical protein
VNQVIPAEMAAMADRQHSVIPTPGNRQRRHIWTLLFDFDQNITLAPRSSGRPFRAFFHGIELGLAGG